MKNISKKIISALCILLSMFLTLTISASAVDVNGRAVLMGVTNSGHNHTSCLSTIGTTLTNCQFTPYYSFRTTNTSTGVMSYLNNVSNTVFVSRSHGGVIYSGSTQVGTRILLNDDESNPVYFSSTDITTSRDFSNLRLAMFIACYTGIGGSGEPNLVNVTVARGAETAVGFKQSIPCSTANTWTVSFFNLMEDSFTVYEACSYLAATSSFSGTTLTDVTICGNRNLVLN